MVKYNIEGDIDFYAELYKSLDIEDNLEEDKNICLITSQPLTDKHVIMSCGHKFNYIAIYKDIVNHKQKFNQKECTTGALDADQIRCPYCRKKQNNLLPYYEELGLEKVNGVNFYDPNIKKTNYSSYSSNHKKCMFKYLNENYDPSKPETDGNSKYLTNMKCYSHGSQIQIYNYSNPLQPITYGDDNYYCYSHKRIMIKKYKAEQKLKAKDEAKAAKELEKQKLKEEKQKAKEEKQKVKEVAKALKKKPVENVVIGVSNILLETIEGCIAVLKSGPNKGKHCGCKTTGDNLCGRHFKMEHNIIINN